MRQETLRKFLLITLFVLAAVLFFYFIVVEWNEPIEKFVKDMGFWAPLGIFILRAMSSIFPALPNSIYAVLAGSVLEDFKTAYITIFLADFISCQVAFLIARNFGREPVRRLVGVKAMKRIESFNQNQLEGNFFLMTGVLMTGFFDFLSYGIGLGGTRWRLFTPSLLTCLIIFDAVAVSIGVAVAGGQSETTGKYSIYLVIALVGMFVLAIISGLIKKKVSLTQGKS